MSGDENKRERNTRSSFKCDECYRYFRSKEAVDSHKTQVHVKKKVAAFAKNTPAKTSSDDSKSSPTTTNTGSIKLTKVDGPVPEHVSTAVKNLIAASNNADITPANPPTTENVVKNDESMNSPSVNSKPLKENEIISELSSESDVTQSNRKPAPVSFKNIGFKCPKCPQQFTSYFVTLRHIEKRHCIFKGEVNKELLEKLKPIRMGECVECNDYFSLSSNHTCAPQIKPATVTMLYNEVSITSTINAKNTIKTSANAKKTIRKEVISPQVKNTQLSDDIETSVDPIALSEEDEVDPTKLMYVKKNSEFKCWGCQRTFINFDGFNSHVLQNHYDEAEIFFVNNIHEFNVLSSQIKNKSGSNYKMLEISSQTPGNYFLQCQSRPMIDKSGIAHYCPSSLILEKFGHIHLVAYCKKHYCSTEGMRTIHNAESLLKKNNTDLYLQFRQITESIIMEAAKVKVGKLNELNEKAKDLAKYIHKINIKEHPVKSVFQNIQGNLDEITEYQEEKKPRKRRMTLSDGLKASFVKKKKSTNSCDYRDESPVHETIVTNVIIENHSPKIKATKKDSPTISVKSVESLNSSVADKFAELKKDLPASFSDTYENFIKQKPDAEDKPKIRTKLGQFPQKNRNSNESPESKKKKKIKPEKTEKTTPKSVPESDSKSNKSVTFSPIIRQSQKPKFIAKKSTALITKTNVMSPKSNVSPKTVLSSPKIYDNYEVKEQENDCNILILKI